MDRKHAGGTSTSPRKNRLRSDSSIYSSTSRRTTASQATLKRTHISQDPNSPQRKQGQMIATMSSFSSTKPSTPKRIVAKSTSSISSFGNRSSSSHSSSGKESSPEVRRKNHSPKSSVSKTVPSSNREPSKSQNPTKKLPGSPTTSRRKNLNNQTRKKSVLQGKNNRKVESSSSPSRSLPSNKKKIQPSKRDIPTRTRGNPNKNNTSGKIPRQRNSPNTKKKLSQQNRNKVESDAAKSNRAKSQEQSKLIPVSNIQIAESQHFDEVSQSNQSNISPIHDSVVEENKNINEETKQKEPFKSKYNLHLALNNCAWEDLYNLLRELSVHTDQIFPEINVKSNDDASVLHTACWKAPVGLIHIIIKLLPTQGDQAKSLYLKQDKDGNTPLHLLCANIMPYYDEHSKAVLDTSVMETLISKAPEVLTMQNIQGETPLHLFVTSYATSTSKFSTFQPSFDITSQTTEALSKIFDNLPSKQYAMIKDNTGATAFHAAIASGADESILMTYLDYCPAVCKVEDSNGMLPLHYAGAFLNIQASVVKRMIEVYQYGTCHKSKFGDTPLHVLVRNSADDVALNETDQVGKKKLLNRNAIQILELLMGNPKLTLMEDGKSLNEGYDPLFITNNEQLTPIHCCALFNASVQATQIIMAHPSAGRAALVPNAFGATPLHLAAALPNVCVDISIAVGTTESAITQDKSSRTPLHVAALNKNATTGLIECIVDLNPSCCTIVDDKGNAPLHVALQSGAKEHIVEALLKACSACIEKENEDQNTPIHEAVKANASIDVVKMLVDQCKEVLNVPNKDKYIPLHLALQSQVSNEIVELLIESNPENPPEILQKALEYIEESKQDTQEA